MLVMPPHLRLGLLVLAASLTLACFRERTPPPAFRFQCESDDECIALVDGNGDPVLDAQDNPYTERCISGLCQYPCAGSLLDLLSQSSTCPAEQAGATCFNGTCNNLCDVASELESCSSPHRCLEISAFDFLANMEIDLSMLPAERPGICGQRCDDDDAAPCPTGQLCLGGICFPLGGATTGDTTGDTTDTGTTG